MGKQELLSIASDLGITRLDGRNSKATIIKAIEGAG